VSHKNSNFQTSWNLRFTALELETFVTILAYTSFDVASDRPASRSVDLSGLFLAKEFVCMFSFLLIVVTSKR
jgi:hypothetical protein